MKKILIVSMITIMAFSMVIMTGCRQNSNTSAQGQINNQNADQQETADSNNSQGATEYVLDLDAFENYGEKVKEHAKICFDNEKDEMGYISMELVHFEKIWEDYDDDGCNLLLYSYDYAIEVNDPDNFMLAGGMYFDDQKRVMGGNECVGELAVKIKDDEVINTALLLNDEMVYPESANEEQKEFIKSFINEKIKG